EDGGYTKPLLWLSEGWAKARRLVALDNPTTSPASPSSSPPTIPLGSPASVSRPRAVSDRRSGPCVVPLNPRLPVQLPAHRAGTRSELTSWKGGYRQSYLAQSGWAALSADRRCLNSPDAFVASPFQQRECRTGRNAWLRTATPDAGKLYEIDQRT